MNSTNKEEIRLIVEEVIKDTGMMRQREVKEVVRAAVQETLITLGIDAKNPLRVQQNMHFIDDFRTASEKVRSKGLLALVGILVAGLAAATWVGLKSSIGAP